MNASFMKSDFMHAPHTGDLLNTRFAHLSQEGNMFGQILKVCRRHMHKTISPCQMQQYVRLIEVMVGVLHFKQIPFYTLGLAIHTITRQIGRNDLVTERKKLINDSTSKISISTSNQNSHHFSFTFSRNLCRLNNRQPLPRYAWRRKFLS